MKKPKISVIIPTFNEEKRLKVCLQSLRNQTYPGQNFEVIVVDNNSTDKTVAIARTFGAKVVFEKEQGIAKARQRGFAKAAGEIVVSLDADNVADRSWLAIIDAEFKKEPKLVSLFGFFLPLEGKFADYVMLFLGSLANILSFYFTHTIVIVGCNQATKKKVLEQIGALAPFDLPKIHCDIFDKPELVKRLKKEGRVKFLPRMKLLFSMRRFHEFGYFATFWAGFKAWLVHRGFSIKSLATLHPRGNSRSGILATLDSALALSLILLATFIVLPFIPALMAFFVIRNTYFDQISFLGLPKLAFQKTSDFFPSYFRFSTPTIFLKRIAITILIFLLVLVPATSYFLVRNSEAKEVLTVKKLRAYIQSLNLDEKLKNLTDIELLQLFDRERLKEILAK